ncbi:ABC-F family ATP-binding cassette domain-containing protein [Tissierella sp. MB52-C2]|uniref:ABC-F family ATP-binding cassette domain-containing protein n=1 Tax=Tissierella sp. MB52-C2 TaxID=3070999 RepID=UPI00280AD4C6|nr:ABC-F family ATP-binding cassette domain-containing protein [Tissierella sp. MB52-C2]WMM26016.1 ABC-F family ATP-binding cassette domain-containing protein [Tissierella sp. MB52-C2]
MNLISIENLSKAYSEKQVLKDINLGINEGDKIGLIGVNGTGKTTLLKVIAGIEEADTGRIVKANNVNIEYLSQDIDFDLDVTVVEQVFRGNSKNIQLVRRYEEAIMNPNTKNEEILKLTEEMDEANAWDLENEAKVVLTKLGITNFNEKVGNLSGGQRKRIALASALINPSELLILDEPTNHLDNDTIEWLEEYLGRRKGAVLMITHDRYFLDRVTNQIIELDSGNLHIYKGNYNYFLEKKLEREEIELASERKRQSLLRKELAWIMRGARARTTKQKARIERFNELKEGGLDISNEKLDISVGGTRLGKKIIEIEDIEKSFDGKKVIDDFSYVLLRDDRVGILGPNGSGKSTLMNIIAGRLEPDKGVVDVGETVKIGIFAQENLNMDNNIRAIEFIKMGGEFIQTADGEKISASQMMERFLFPKDLQWTPIGKLSGGEKRRLHLLRVLMEAPNVLLLDEPTNDLDIDTLTVLEEYIEEFPGPVIIVSHDRYLLDKIVEKLFVFEGNGKIVGYTGNYQYFKEASKIEKEDNIVDHKPKHRERQKTNSKLKFSYNEQREWNEIDNIIAELEENIVEIDKKIEAAATDYTKLQELLEEKEEVENKLEEKMERWIYLSELAEKIEEQNQN